MFKISKLTKLPIPVKNIKAKQIENSRKIHSMYCKNESLNT